MISGTLDSSASQSGTPAGTYNITITADDGQLGTIADTFDWFVTNTNNVAVADTDSLNEAATLSIPAAGVLTNDTDADNDALEVDEVEFLPGNVGVQLAATSGALFTFAGVVASLGRETGNCPAGSPAAADGDELGACGRTL